MENIQKCRVGANGNCTVHGGMYVPALASCQTTEVLLQVREERARQFAQYGDNSDLEDGTGPLKPWLSPLRQSAAYEIERELRKEYLNHEAAHGKPTWMHLIREEVAEAFMEDDPARLRAELLQVAALAVSWIEKLDARAEAHDVAC